MRPNAERRPCCAFCGLVPADSEVGGERLCRRCDAAFWRISLAMAYEAGLRRRLQDDPGLAATLDAIRGLPEAP
ncbi:MAG TPA: hypothetical protein VMD09_12795 [Solirubrobacteraceae bacterium]|nr:hypothetical protein [Solirubrobacteraceae bacterium]